MVLAIIFPCVVLVTSIIVLWTCLHYIPKRRRESQENLQVHEELLPEVYGGIKATQVGDSTLQVISPYCLSVCLSVCPWGVTAGGVLRNQGYTSRWQQFVTRSRSERVIRVEIFISHWPLILKYWDFEYLHQSLFLCLKMLVLFMNWTINITCITLHNTV